MGMRFRVLALCVLLALSAAGAYAAGWQPTAGHTQITIWPGKVPDVRAVPGPETVTKPKDLVAGKPWISVTNVTHPTMTVYSPKGKNTGAAAVVFPGGGYQILAMDLEGTEICDWLTSRGITAVLLKYRVPIKRVGPYGESAQALEDAQRTLRLVRFNASKWHVNPHKIGVIGFSAGGHMVAAMSTLYNKRLYPAVDAADKVSSRPDFAMAIYPGHLYNEDKGYKLNPHVPVTKETPPTFLLMNENDDVDGVDQMLVYYIALKNAGVPTEMHSYAQGGHAFGLRPTKLPVSGWTKLAETWLRTIGVVK